MRPSNAPQLDEDEFSPNHKEVIDARVEFELPPLFVKEGTANEPVNRPICFAYVWKKDPQTRELGFIDWKPIEDCSDVPALRDLFGPGVYQIQGRGANRKDVIKFVTHTIGGAREAALAYAPPPRAEFNVEKLVATAMAAAAPLLAMWERFSDQKEKRDETRRLEEERRRADERQREDARNQSFMTTMTELMKSRMADLETLLKSQQSNGSTAGKLDSYQQGQADTIEMIRSVKEEGLGGQDSESKVLDLIGSFVTGKNVAEKDLAGGGTPPVNGAAT